MQEAARNWLIKTRSVTGYLIKDVSPQINKVEQTDAPAAPVTPAKAEKKKS